jgi:heterodisulfide reductase subunit C
MHHPDKCTQCGTCVTVCPVEMVGGHAIVTFLADPQAADYSVWLCSSCWRCTEACPSRVDIHGLMMAERRRQPAPPWYQVSFERILTTGLSLDNSQEELAAMRAGLDLEDVRLPPPGLASQLLQGNLEPA